MTPEDVAIICGWEDAAKRWLSLGEGGEHWPGGRHNKTLLIDKVWELRLEDASDKYAVLTIAFDELKRTGALQPPADDQE
jgi:hypothetical protein